MEIQNQNGVTTTAERLNELKKEKQEAQELLSQVQRERAALNKEKAEFKTYKEEQEAKLVDDRNLMLREIENHKNNLQNK